MNSRDRREAPSLVASPKYPWRSYSPLRTHDFIEAPPSGSSPPLRVFICRSCDRSFKFDVGARMTWAIAKDERLSALQDAVNRRWLSETCVGRSDTNEADRKLIKKARSG